MNLLDLGCACLTIPHLKALMDVASYPGKGEFAIFLGAAAWIYGYARDDRKAKQLGYAILIALTLIGIVTAVLKFSLQFPRPTPRSGFGFPSGDSATAFGLAAVASVAYPAAAALFHFLATLTAVGRLYFRAHFVWDVLGGALLGGLCGFAVARRLLSVRAGWKQYFRWSPTWIPCIALGAAAIGFFALLEREISRHKIGAETALQGREMHRVDFGTASARSELIAGWAPDGVWPSERFPFNWGEGLVASVNLHIDAPQDARLLLRMYPYRPRGFLCQRAAITINGVFLGRVWLEQDWQRYAIHLPGDRLRRGANRLDFTFVYADRTNWHGMNPERRALSVAFQKIHLIGN